MRQNESTARLSDELYELSLTQEVPDAALLDEFVRRYPEHADDLTDFAIMLAIDSLAEDKLSPAVSRAMSRFYNRLHAVQSSENISVERSVPASEIPPNPFATLDRAAFRGMVQRLNVNTAFAIKLRDRHIVPETIPKKFTDQLAQELEVPPGVLMEYLNVQGQSQMQGQFYKAADKPQLDIKQTFCEAAKSSGLNDEQQRLLLAM